MVGSTAPPSSTKNTKRSTAASAAVARTGDFELRHWHSSARRRPSLRRRAITSIPPAISIPEANGNHKYHLKDVGGGSNCSSSGSNSPSSSSNYISLRDIIGSPPPSANSISSPCSNSYVASRVRNRLVVRAAHAYLQLTPSGAETSSSHHCHKGGTTAIGRCFFSCFGFLRHLFDSFRPSS